MKKIIYSILAIFTFCSSSLKAQEFFDTSDPDRFFTIGARVGFNTSNRTFPEGPYVNTVLTSWGTGFNAGVVANLNIKDYLTIQPGFFYESRSSNLINIAEYSNVSSTKSTYYEKDHLLGYYFTVPVMGVVNFNLSDDIRWNVEFGPYLQFTLKQKGQNNVTIISLPNEHNGHTHFYGKPKSFDFGFKMGSGLTFFEHYYVGFHYMAGVLDAWKIPAGGNNRAWTFTLGYNFM